MYTKPFGFFVLTCQQIKKYNKKANNTIALKTSARKKIFRMWINLYLRN